MSASLISWHDFSVRETMAYSIRAALEAGELLTLTSYMASEQIYYEDIEKSLQRWADDGGRGLR